MEMNPNHPVTQKISDHWHKLAGLLMVKFGAEHVVITAADIEAMAIRPGGLNITIQELDDGLHLRLVDNREAAALARKHGGLPT
ncbi:hypothetical protein [Thalassobaculum litoreum]|uniref:Uncharacterized protein n=1 Tax=Thalassobaculum litoreum DSM 18839 TaxID=1123362 RepID=A0A8G2BI46_9PROT|nr:hypothetical protein [Thalassobaculum litoreum]SDF84475.1 hypothetical protein SAMN05660686_02512 [Thalassobaculum litoreum DSM 18839]